MMPDFRRLDRTAQRGLVARMSDDRQRGRDLLGPRDQRVVFGCGRFREGTYGR